YAIDQYLLPPAISPALSTASFAGISASCSTHSICVACEWLACVSKRQRRKNRGLLLDFLATAGMRLPFPLSKGRELCSDFQSFWDFYCLAQLWCGRKPIVRRPASHKAAPVRRPHPVGSSRNSRKPIETRNPAATRKAIPVARLLLPRRRPI